MTLIPPPTLDDAQLLHTFVATRSPEVFRSLVDRHLPAIHAAATRILRPASLTQHSEDIAQSVFILLAQDAAKIPAGTPLVGWLYRVTHYACANLQKTERRRRQREAAAMRPITSTPATVSEAEALLDPAILTLSAHDRDTLLLRYTQNLPLAEIARLTHVPPVTAKKRLRRALQKLRQYFAAQGMLSAAPLALHALAPAQSAAFTSMASTITAAALAPATATTGTSILIAKGVALMMHVSSATKITLATVTALLLLIAGYTTASLLKFQPPSPISPASSPGGTAPVAPNPIDAWRDLINQSAQARQAVTSLQFHMEATYRDGSQENPQISMKYTIDYKQQLPKFYVLFHATGEHHFADPVPFPGINLPQNGTVDSGEEDSFDGALFRTRSFADKNLLSQTRNLEKAIPPHPLPWITLEFHSPKELQELLASNKFALAPLKDVQDKDSHLRIVTFNYVPSGHIFYRVSYDASHGLLPVKAEEFAEDGSLTAEVRGVTILKMQAKDESFYLPTTGIVETFDAGKSYMYKDFHLDPATIVVNQTLSEETFQLTPHPNEKVYDCDTSTILADKESASIVSPPSTLRP